MAGGEGHRVGLIPYLDTFQVQATPDKEGHTAMANAHPQGDPQVYPDTTTDPAPRPAPQPPQPPSPPTRAQGHDVEVGRMAKRRYVAGEPIVVPSSEPLPESTDLLVAQIKELAEQRRKIAARHIPRCPCTACNVRRKTEPHAVRRAVA